MIPEFENLQGKLQLLAASVVGLIAVWRVYKVYAEGTNNSTGSDTETNSKAMMHQMLFAGIVIAAIYLVPSIVQMIARMATSQAS